MANIALGEFYRVTFAARMGGQNAINVRTYRVGTSGLGTVSVKQLADRLGEVFGPLYKAVMANSATFFGVEVRQLGGPMDSDKNATSTAGAGAGTAGVQSLPPQTCGLIQLKTGIKGRRRRGRVYIPFPSEDHNTEDGAPNFAWLPFMEALGQQLVTPVGFVAPLDGWSVEAVIKGPLDIAANAYADIIEYRVRGRWATQRRRSYIGSGDGLPF